MFGWFRPYRIYLALVALWLVAGGAGILLTGRDDLHLALNAVNPYGYSEPILLVTLLSDQRVAWVIGAVLCLKRVRWGVAVMVSVITAALTATMLKYLVFGPVLRPVPHFGDPSPLHLLPDFEHALEYSMPSGHATVGFALCTSLALLARWWWLQVACFIAALVIAYSRVYLSQHFFEDIYVGSIVGMICAFAAHAAVRPHREPARPRPEE